MIQTPYGPKTPEFLCKAMDAHSALVRLEEEFANAIDSDEPIGGAECVEWVVDFIITKVRPVLGIAGRKQ